MITLIKYLWTRFRFWRLSKKSAALRAQILEEKRLHGASRKLAALSIHQLQRIARRRPEQSQAAQAELTRRLLRPHVQRLESAPA